MIRRLVLTVLAVTVSLLALVYPLACWAARHPDHTLLQRLEP